VEMVELKVVGYCSMWRGGRFGMNVNFKWLRPSREQNFGGYSRDIKGRYPDFDLRMMQDESAAMISLFC